MTATCNNHQTLDKLGILGIENGWHKLVLAGPLPIALRRKRKMMKQPRLWNHFTLLTRGFRTLLDGWGVCSKHLKKDLQCSNVQAPQSSATFQFSLLQEKRVEATWSLALFFVRGFRWDWSEHLLVFAVTNFCWEVCERPAAELDGKHNQHNLQLWKTQWTA